MIKKKNKLFIVTMINHMPKTITNHEKYSEDNKERLQKMARTQYRELSNE